MTRTSMFIGPLLRFLFPEAPEETLLIYHGYVRKMAHFTLYAGLALWSWRAFHKSNTQFLRNYWFPSSLLLVLIIASLDEYNQSFLNSRTGSLYDVLIDFSGGLAMLSLVLLAAKLKNSRRSLV